MDVKTEYAYKLVEKAWSFLHYFHIILWSNALTLGKICKILTQEGVSFLCSQMELV